MMKTVFSSNEQLTQADDKHVKVCATIKVDLDKAINSLVDKCANGYFNEAILLRPEIEKLNWLHSIVMQQGFKALEAAKKRQGLIQPLEMTPN